MKCCTLDDWPSKIGTPLELTRMTLRLASGISRVLEDHGAHPMNYCLKIDLKALLLFIWNDLHYKIKQEKLTANLRMVEKKIN